MAAAPLLIAASLFAAGAGVKMQKDAAAKAKGPQLPDYSSLLAQAPNAKDTAVDEEALARRRNRRASAPSVPSPTMLTGPLGTTGAAPTQRKTLLGM